MRGLSAGNAIETREAIAQLRGECARSSICRVHARSESAAEDASARVLTAVELADAAPETTPAISKRTPG